MNLIYPLQKLTADEVRIDQKHAWEYVKKEVEHDVMVPLKASLFSSTIMHCDGWKNGCEQQHQDDEPGPQPPLCDWILTFQPVPQA